MNSVVRIPTLLLFFGASLFLTSCHHHNQTTERVEWADQIMYFLLIDRFADGDPTNNDQGAGEYNPNRDITWHGGDLKGIQQQLDYLEILGITAVWITPPVRNQWWNPDTSFTGYHGYWAEHFMEVDPHYGTLIDYQDLARDMHQRNMYLIQDVVVNHTGNYFSYRDQYNPNHPDQLVTYVGHPSQTPFNLNDPRNPEHLAQNIYHWTPMIRNFQDTLEKYTGQMADLDDLNTANPKVRQALIESFQFWIREVGVDGFRFDTPLYVEHPFWQAFLHKGSGDLAGIEPFAATLGKMDFYTFGETWVSALPFDDEADKFAAKYLGTPNNPEMDGILNFTLLQTIQDVMAGGLPTDRLTYRLELQQKLLPDPIQRLHFIDNHDMPRFRTQASEAATRQALFFIMNIPGVPIIYQGTEQGDLLTRPNMFGRTDPTSEPFTFLRDLIRFRKNHPATRTGDLTILADENHTPGLFVYQLQSKEERLLVALNTRDYPLLATQIKVPGSAGNTLEPLQMINGSPIVIQGERDLIDLRLSPKGAVVIPLDPIPDLPSPDDPPFADTSLSEEVWMLTLPNNHTDSSFWIMDGRFDTRTPFLCDGQACVAQISLRNLSSGIHKGERISYQNEHFHSDAKRYFEVELPKREIVRKQDPIHDDQGPAGTYLYPTHPTFKRPNDFKSLRIERQGHNLDIHIQMSEPLSTVWNPVNGFDHLHLSVLIDLPNLTGARVIPQRNASMPGESNWDLHIEVNGWTTKVHSSQGADTDSPGTARTAKPLIQTEAKTGIIRLSIPASAIGNPISLDGVQFYVLSWDSAGEGDLRPLRPQPESFTYGGGSPGAPLIMDAIWTGND